MNTTIKKKLDYRCFLLGIIVYWMFEVVWASFSPFFFFLENLPMNPIAVVFGKSVLYLLVFYFLFRKPKMLNIKWKHVAIMVGFLVLMNMLDYFLIDRMFDQLNDNRVFSDVPDYVLRDVRKWANLVTSFLIIGFVWWRYDSENAEADENVSLAESHSYYGGILFTITLGYILSLIGVLGSGYWNFAHLPILVEVITCMLVILVSIGAICMLVKRQTVVLSITVIFIIIAIYFFSSQYLPSILSKCFTPNGALYGQVTYFGSASVVCDIAFNLAAFFLYRKEMKRQIL